MECEQSEWTAWRAKCQRFTRNIKSNPTPAYGNKSEKMHVCLVCQESVENGVTFGQNRSENHDWNSRCQQTAQCMCAVLSANRAIFPSLSHSLAFSRLFIFFQSTDIAITKKNKNQNRNDWIYRKRAQNKNSNGMFRFPIRIENRVTATIENVKINWSKLVSFRFSDSRSHKVARTKWKRCSAFVVFLENRFICTIVEPHVRIRVVIKRHRCHRKKHNLRNA